jgi:hypothetical protein
MNSSYSSPYLAVSESHHVLLLRSPLLRGTAVFTFWCAMAHSNSTHARLSSTAASCLCVTRPPACSFSSPPPTQCCSPSLLRARHGRTNPGIVTDSVLLQCFPLFFFLVPCLISFLYAGTRCETARTSTVDTSYLLMLIQEMSFFLLTASRNALPFVLSMLYGVEKNRAIRMTP